MADLHVKYSRAENGVDAAEIDNDGTGVVVHLRRRNGMSKLEKILVATTVFLVFVSAVFAALYLSERRYRNLKEHVASSENGGENCNGPDENKDEKERNKPKGTCCSNEVTKQAALGKDVSLIIVVYNF